MHVHEMLVNVLTPFFINISNTLPATHKTSKYKVVKQLLHAKHI